MSYWLFISNFPPIILNYVILISSWDTVSQDAEGSRDLWRACGAQPASGSPLGLTETTTSALEELEVDRTGPSHGSHPLHPPHLRGARDTDHTTEGSRARHPSPKDLDPEPQQIIKLTLFGDHYDKMIHTQYYTW